MHVRRIRADEFALLREVRLAALLDSPDAFCSTYASSAARSEDEWKQMARSRAEGDEEAGFFLFSRREAEHADEEAVGIVATCRDREDRSVVHLISMWVAPQARGKGGGTSLVEAACAWAEATSGVQRVRLNVSPKNERAVGFYLRLGFTATSTDDQGEVTLEKSCH